MITCLLDDSALLALGRGHPDLSGFIVAAHVGKAVVGVPTLCLCAAEAQRPGITDHVGALPVEIEPLELSTTVPIGRLISAGTDWQIAHAVAAALPSIVYPDGRTVVSMEPERYDGTGVRPARPDEMG